MPGGPSFQSWPNSDPQIPAGLGECERAIERFTHRDLIVYTVCLNLSAPPVQACEDTPQSLVGAGGR
jgi:hypothetical protein